MGQSKLVPMGLWGGSGIRLTVEKKNVKIEHCCAEGEIAGRLKAGPGGNFSADGFHITARPGPLRADAKAVRRPARYEVKCKAKP